MRLRRPWRRSRSSLGDHDGDFVGGGGIRVEGRLVVGY